MIGALVIDSQGTPDCLPIFNNPVEGKHTDGIHRGTWWFDPESAQSHTVYLPQRDRTVQVYTHDHDLPNFNWEHHMAAWDLKDDQTQYDKLEALRAELPSEISTVSIHMQYNTNNLGTWSLLRNSFAPVYLYGVQSDRTTYLVWSTEDIVNSLRMLNPGAYCIFRFASGSRQVFLNTQAICSKWWRWNSKFGPNTLKMFNALEVMLLKVK